MKTRRQRYIQYERERNKWLASVELVKHIHNNDQDKIQRRLIKHPHFNRMKKIIKEKKQTKKKKFGPPSRRMK